MLLNFYYLFTFHMKNCLNPLSFIKRKLPGILYHPVAVIYYPLCLTNWFEKVVQVVQKLVSDQMSKAIREKYHRIPTVNVRRV